MNDRLYLLIRDQKQLQRIFRVEADETTIGRDQTNMVPLPDPRVSRQHAVLCRLSTGYWIRDLQSRNGTRVNGHSIQEARIGEKAIMEIAEYSLIVCSDFHTTFQATTQSVISTFWQLDIKSPPRQGPHADATHLTPAQRRVYDEFLTGASEKEVASVLKISIHTVHSHSKAIYTLFGVSSRAELLARCMPLSRE